MIKLIATPINIESTACEVLRQYPVKRAALFGSSARGDMTAQSDIDMLVEFLPDTRGIEFFGLHVDLEEAFGCHVDLITYESLHRQAKPKFRERILKDERVFYERAN
ncbi:MAG: nucleotidyltransferase family protein [Defluviitaleaceae bacterium]|nr:nucleotidyltransferase family protein [Defluviitaleaceae bacterium]